MKRSATDYYDTLPIFELIANAEGLSLNALVHREVTEAASQSITLDPDDVRTWILHELSPWEPLFRSVVSRDANDP